MDYCEGCVALAARVAALEARLAEPPRDVIDPGTLYVAKEAAGLLRCSLANVYDLIESQSIAVVSTGVGKKGFRLRGADILAFLESRKTGGPKPAKFLKNLKGIP